MRGLVRRALVASLLLGLLLGASIVAAPAAPAAVVGQAPPTVPVQECVPGAIVPTNLPANGPSPVGSCEPSGRQRLIDSFVWLFLVALLGLLAVIGIVALVRSLRGRPGVGAAPASVPADD